VVAPELSSRGGRTRSHETRGSAGAHLGREVRLGAEKHVTAPELNSVRRRGPGPWATWHHRSSPSKEVRSGAARDVAAPKPTFAGMCDSKLQLT
jgi:hypothetical protein